MAVAVSAMLNGFPWLIGMAAEEIAIDVVASYRLDLVMQAAVVVVLRKLTLLVY